MSVREMWLGAELMALEIERCQAYHRAAG